MMLLRVRADGMTAVAKHIRAVESSGTLHGLGGPVEVPDTRIIVDVLRLSTAVGYHALCSPHRDET